MEKRMESVEKSILHIQQEIQQLREVISLGFTKSNTNFENISNEISTVHKKVDSINKKVDALQGSTDENFDEVGFKLENLTEEIKKIGTVTRYPEEYENLRKFN